MKSFLVLLIAFSSGNLVLAGDYQRGFSRTRTCTRNEYREEYIPGNRSNPGYVKTWEETVEVPCKNHSPNSKKPIIDTNDCSEGTVAGGILGGGLATAISRGKDRWWAIPAGIVGGSMVGCQIDGG